jgi:signal transduction histidine kinase
MDPHDRDGDRPRLSAPERSGPISGAERHGVPGRSGPSGRRLRPEPLRPGGLGLRAQIGLALFTGLALSVVLVAVAADRLSTRALEIERRHAATLAARAVAAMIQRLDAPPLLLDRAEQALVGQGDVTGFELLGPAGAVETRGVVGEGLAAEAQVAGGRVRAWATHPGDAAARRLVGLLVLYALVSAVAILLLSFVLLTRLIVRPIEQLERSAERLARGEGGASARIEGAREVASLAVTFNTMGEELRDERAALEARLAELERALTALEQAKSSLVRSEKLASVGRLAAGVAHEIGNPLAAILGLVELLRGGGLEPAEQDEFLRRVQGETERIHRIIRGLLDFARPPGTARDGRGAVVASCVEDAVHLVAPQKDLRRVRIERRIPEGLPPVRLDADGLTQVVLNLLLNAADAIETKRSARASADEGAEDTILVEAELIADGTSVRLAVIDSGTGIDEAARASLFEPFFTTKPVGRGTGLGLAVCLTMIEQVGGTLTADDHEAGGARFELTLPVARGPGAGPTQEGA